MSNPDALRALRDTRPFTDWDGFVPPDRVEAAEANIAQLVDDLLALGTEPTEEAARTQVDQCVRRFNGMDDGWISTIEREVIYSNGRKAHTL